MLVCLLRDLYGDYGLSRASTAIDLPPYQARRLIARGLAVPAQFDSSPQQQAFQAAPEKKTISEVERSNPLVTCIMPTANRARFIPGSIHNFLAQTYEPRELLIVDDGAEPVAHLIPQLNNIRYLRLESRMPLGAKRNYAVASASGEIIAHWDDDDRYAPDRLANQIKALLSSPEAVIVGYRDIDFLTNRGIHWRMTGEPDYIAGTSMVYWRAWAMAHPFPSSQSIGEDNAFLSRCAGRVKILAGNGSVVCRIHAANSVTKRPGGRGWRRIEKGRIPQWAES